MADSDTTARQKQVTFDGIKEMVDYLQIHALECIYLADLKMAARALDRMDMVIKP